MMDDNIGNEQGKKGGLMPPSNYLPTAEFIPVLQNNAPIPAEDERSVNRGYRERDEEKHARNAALTCKPSSQVYAPSLCRVMPQSS